MIYRSVHMIVLIIDELVTLLLQHMVAEDTAQSSIFQC